MLPSVMAPEGRSKPGLPTAAAREPEPGVSVRCPLPSPSRARLGSDALSEGGPRLRRRLGHAAAGPLSPHLRTAHTPPGQQECRLSLAQCICQLVVVCPPPPCYAPLPHSTCEPRWTACPPGVRFIRVPVARRPGVWLRSGRVSLLRDFPAGLPRPMAMPRPCVWVSVSSLGGLPAQGPPTCC